MIEVNAENYYDASTNMEYLSASQVKAFLNCEAAAMAELTGEVVREESPALLIGGMVDAELVDGMGAVKYVAQHPEMMMRNGKLKAEYQHGYDIIKRARQDRFFMKYLGGEHQTIMTGEAWGQPFKIKMDSYFPGRCIVDLKVMKDMKSVYTPEHGRQTFIEAWGYDVQGAIYQAVVEAVTGCKLPFFIACITKEHVPDIAVIRVPQEALDAAGMIVAHNVERIASIKRGEVEPMRCERCDYCKTTKILTAVTDMADLEGAI